MKINYIKSRMIKQDRYVYLRDEEDVLLEQPDLPKDELGLFNYWTEKKRSGQSDSSCITKLVLDFDGGRLREDVINQFKEFEFIIYSSTGNTSEKDKFRIILSLAQPISAKDLKYNRRLKKFRIYFNGADTASFSVGQFFVVPSKYDKDGNEVEVMKNNGRKFDFFMVFGHCPPTNDAFDKVVYLMKYGSQNKRAANGGVYEDRLKAYAEEKGGLHYMDIYGFINKAKRCNVDYSTAKSIYNEYYAGHSDWNKNFDNAWNTINL